MTVPPPPGDNSTPPPPPPPPPAVPPMPPTGVQQQPTNGAATASLVLGILSFVCSLSILAAIPAIILGVAGKKKAKELGGIGEGQAKAGVILGWINIALSIVGTLIFILLVIVAADDVRETNDRANRVRQKAESSLDEYEDQLDRQGETARRSHFDVTDPNVEVSSYGYVTYSAYIENKADFDTGFVLEVKCEGNLGETKTTDAYASGLAPGDREEVTASFSFAAETTSAECEVSRVTYGY